MISRNLLILYAALVFQVALEVIEELCYEMGLHRLEAIKEYAVFLVTSRGVFICVNLLLVFSDSDPSTDHISTRQISFLLCK